MAYTWDEIWNAMQQRRNQDSLLLRQMIGVRDRYNGEVVIPLPDVEGSPVVGSLTPQIVADGIDHTAMRAASVMPSVSCPALARSDRAHEVANTKRRAIYAGWYNSAIELLLYRAFRHFIGYGTAALVAVPDFIGNRAVIELRDPLSAYPELRTPEDFHEPLNVGFVYGRSTDWVLRNYPQAADHVKKGGHDVIWDMVEWIDADHIVIGLLGPRNPTYTSSGRDDRYYPGYTPAGGSLELRRWENRAGMVPISVPRRCTLDRIMGQLTHVLPAVDLLERITALEMIAAERHVFPDMVILGKRTSVPTLSGGRWKDGREGEPNIILDADGVQLLQPAVGPATFASMDRLEKSARISGGVPELFGGVNGPGLRTGRALDSLGAFSIDPRVMEAQKFMQRALSCVTSGMMAVEKGYWPSKKYTVFSGWSGDTEVVDYTPAKHFENLDNSVDYSLPGLDISQTTVALSQLVGARLISRDTAREKHPLIPDGRIEGKAVIREQVEDAILMSFLQQAQQGSLPLIDLVEIGEQYDKGASMAEAVRAADRIARERQAALQPETLPPEDPALAGMPGLAPPGMGAEAAPAPPQGPPSGGGRLQALLSAISAPPGGGPPGA